MRQKLLGGSLYFMLLIDDYTMFTAVYFLKKKVEKRKVVLISWC